MKSAPPKPTFSPRLSQVAIVLPAFLLAACATTPAPRSSGEITTPATWKQADASISTQTSDPISLAQWWTRLNDPTLDQLISEALTANPDIRTALSRIEQSKASRTIQRSTLLPSVNAGVSGQASRTRHNDTDTTTTADSYSANLSASWELDLFGKNRLSLEAATADLAQSQENLHATQVSLAAEVATNYVNLLTLRSRLDLVERTLTSREETIQLIRWREEAGVGSSLDTNQAETSLEQARASIPSLQQSITETLNQLAVLCGRTPGSLDDQLKSIGHIPVATGEIAVGIPAETLRQRPDIRAAEQSVRAANARSASARRDRLPTLSLSGSLGINASQAGDLFSPQTTVANLVGNLTAPIFNAGKIKQNIRIQDETTKQALISYESTVLNALSEVENALASLRHTDERLGYLEKATAAARITDQLAHQQYQAGQADYLTVLDSERTLLSLETDLLTTHADQTDGYIQLYRALGGGWNSETETAANP